MGIFRRKPTGPALPSSGHEGDDQLLGFLSQTDGGLSATRHWVHYVYCDDESGAATMEATALAGGWDVRRVDPGHHGIIAERSDLAVNLETTPDVRRFFEGLARSVPGGDYDGWEASA